MGITPGFVDKFGDNSAKSALLGRLTREDFSKARKRRGETAGRKLRRLRLGFVGVGIGSGAFVPLILV